MALSKTSIIVLAVILFTVAVVIPVASVLIGIGIWLGVGDYAFTSALMCGPQYSSCPRYSYHTPFNYSTTNGCEPYRGKDMSKYWLPRSYERNLSLIHFSPRDASWQGSLDAWFLSYDNMTAAPVVILVHGIRQCKKSYTVLAPAVMLYRQGYNVIIPDLRSHGDSEAMDPPVCTFGSEEHKDILGLVDWIKTNYPAQKKLGIMGVSMGGSTAIIAFEKEPALKAMHLDSAPCDVLDTIKNGIFISAKVQPDSVITGMCAIARSKWKSVCPDFEESPEFSAKKIGSRPIHWEHSDSDLLVPPWNMKMCTDIFRLAGANVTTFTQKTTVASDTLGHCDNHVVNVIIDTQAYEKRLIEFFANNLK